jgi:putative ABC transport system substrate-binding protein
MRRRAFISLLGGAAAAWPLVTRAQQKPARIGFLRQAGPHEKQFEAFREGLRAAGYVEGQNIVIEQRYAAGAYDRLNALAMEKSRCVLFQRMLTIVYVAQDAERLPSPPE